MASIVAAEADPANPGTATKKPLVVLWREAILSPTGPPDATTRLVLLALAHYMNAHGSAFPSQRLLADGTNLSRRAVGLHLTKAHSTGWIVREVKGSSRGWRRHSYQARFPEAIEIEEAAP